MADSNVTCMGGWQSDIIHTCEVVALARPTRGGTHLPGDCLAGPWLLRGRTRIVLRRRFRAPETISPEAITAGHGPLSESKFNDMSFVFTDAN